MEVALSTIRGLIRVDEVGSCVAIVAAGIIDVVRGMGTEDGVVPSRVLG